MTKLDVAKMIGLTTRQHLDLVLSGKRNFSFRTAQKATVVIGGTVTLWLDQSRADERKKIWAEFKRRIKNGEA